MKYCPRPFFRLLAGFASACMAFSVLTTAASGNPTASTVWQDFAANPYNHLNIPNNAYAGYRGGKMPIPDVPVVVNLLDHGGNGDGLTDNTEAFQRAIEAAWIAGGGAVYIPAGVYVVDKMIHLNKSGVVLRGAGRDQTTILLTGNMDTAVGPMHTGTGGTHWFWQGGMIWMGPAAQLRRNFVYDSIHQGVNMGVDTGAWWPDEPSNHGLVGKRIANVTGEHAEGSFTVTADDASELREGEYFRMVYRNKANAGDYDLYREMVGHPLMQDHFPWANATALNNFTQWVWPVRIARIDGNEITLDQPLRVRTRAKFEAGFETIGEIITESGIDVLNSIGRPGGNNNTGPLNGRRVVHWNIKGNTGSNNGEYVNMPDAHSHGALVGVQGIRSNAPAWAMVPGDKGNIIADEGIVPIYPDLHLKQRELRMQMEPFVEFQTPRLDLIPPGPTTLTAVANGGPGAIQSVAFKVDGNVIHTATAAPYSAAWDPQPGAYEVELVMQTTDGTYHSPRRTVQVGQREIIQDNDTRMVYTGHRSVVSDPDALGGTYTSFRADHNTHVTFNFRGTRFMVYVHNLQPTQQRMNIFINDLSNPAQFVDVRRFTEPRYMVYDSGSLPEGDYTVMIKPPSHQVMLDYVVIENTGEFGGGTLPNIPVAPSNLTVTATTDTKVTLSWSDNSTNEAGFALARAFHESGPWAEIALLPADTTAYDDTGLEPSTTYVYRILAFNEAGDSDYSAPASATTLQAGAGPLFVSFDFGANDPDVTVNSPVG